MSLNIFGDIAGEYKTLMALKEKMPKGIPVSVGDMPDRGKDSYNVIEFFRENGRAVLGNHEHMMLDFLKDTGKYDGGVWFQNGGRETLMSYFRRKYGFNYQFGVHDYEDFISCVPVNHIKYLESLPLFIEDESEHGKILITHAPINPVVGLEKACKNVSEQMGGAYSVIWNRGKPKAIEGVKLQIHGHNASHQVEWFGRADNNFAVCLDTCRAKVLTGMHWPSMEIFQQDFID